MYWTLFTIQQRLRIPGTHDNLLWILLTIDNFLLTFENKHNFNKMPPTSNLCTKSSEVNCLLHLMLYNSIILILIQHTFSARITSGAYHSHVRHCVNYHARTVSWSFNVFENNMFHLLKHWIILHEFFKMVWK